MILIRRAIDSKKAYTVIMLPGEPAKWIPTTDYEHQRILEIFLQDKYYEGIENDFTEDAIFLKSTLDIESKDINITKKNNEYKK